MLQMDILLYGGEGGGDLRPEFVPQGKWFIAADFQPNENITVWLMLSLRLMPEDDGCRHDVHRQPRRLQCALPSA